MDQFIALCQQFGAAFTQITHLYITSMVVGAIIAYLFEIPILSKIKKR